MASVAVFFISCLIRPFLLKKIVESTGGEWNWQSPLKNISEERRALKVLPANGLRNQLRLVNIVAISSWLVGLLTLVLHKVA
jgi:hypothetical protein